MNECNQRPGKRPMPGESPHGGSFQAYTQFKRIKLQNQMSESFHKSSQGQLFQDKCFWVNGFTTPPLSKLKPLIVSRGGSIELTLTSKVNHILSDVEPNASGSRIVSKASWITDSIQTGSLLPVSDYSFRIAPNQKKISPKQTPKFNHSHNNANEKTTQTLSPGKPRSTLNDPNFVHNFFQSSRLHFIGSWKDHLEGKLSELHSITPRFNKPSASEHCIYLHVDMDCFFASVAMRSDPLLRDLPIAVAHSSSGTAEISSCNYVARKYNVRAGMFVRDALAKCSSLKVVPYQFEQYLDISERIYNIFFGISHNIQIGSCDEVFIGLPFGEHGIYSIECVEEIARDIRSQIYSTTECTASIGISHNLLLARMATKRAKPDGVFYLSPEHSSSYMAPLLVRDLPGIGWKVAQAFKEHQLNTCLDIQNQTLQQLQTLLGPAKGRRVYDNVRGIDDTELVLGIDRKSLAVEIGWGVRFQNKDQLADFVKALCVELSQRLQKSGKRTTSLVFKMKKAVNADKEPSKFLGHGHCDSFSRSTNCALTDDANVLFIASMQCVRHLSIPPHAVRAVGISAHKLQRDGEGIAMYLSKPVQHLSKLSASQALREEDACPLVEELVEEVPPVCVSVPSPEKKPRIAPETKAKAKRNPGNQISIAKAFKSQKRKPCKSKQKKISFTSRNMKRNNVKVDPEVLKELPLHIRREVEREYGQQCRIDSFFTKKAPTLVETIKVPEKEVQEFSNPHLSYSEIFSTLQNESPTKVTEMITKQIRFHNLPSLQIAMRMYKRHSSPSQFEIISQFINQQISGSLAIFPL